MKYIRGNRMFRLLLSIAILATAPFLSGCSQSDSDSGVAPTGEPIGLISAREFDSSTLPTMGQYQDAYDAVTTESPALLNDQEMLARAIFDHLARIESRSVSAKSEAASDSPELPFFYNSYLSRNQWRLALEEPLNFIEFIVSSVASIIASEIYFPCEKATEGGPGTQNTKTDALRHAYWNALMTSSTSLEFATLAADLNEEGAAADAPNGTAMDLHNNRVGRQIAADNPGLSGSTLLEILLDMSIVYVPNAQAIPSGYDGLVFIRQDAVQHFDGHYTGVLTNPDSGGGDWSLTINMSQCGTILRGNMREVRGSEFLNSRITGSVLSDSNLSIDVGAPSGAFELEGSRCEDMVMELAASSGSLTGPWTSSNCPSGGEITATKAPFP